MMWHGMHELLYKMQLVGYDSCAYWDLVPKKTQGRVKVTARIKRLRVVTVLLCIVGLGLPLLCLAQTVAVANWLLRPYEQSMQKKFIRKAQQILAKRSDLIRIGITGSYGKTTVKNILAQMLSVKYRVVASPASFNTPLGFARTINEDLKADTQVLIMEMGARRRGEIRELCELLQPQHGIITSIGACHLATFGDIETVAQTKAELFAALPADAVAVTDGDNEYCRALQHPHLTLVKAAEQPVFVTSLLGQHQQKNIQMAAVLARALGVSDKDIRSVVKNLQPTPHRLERIVAPNGIIIFDDSYNANPVSAQSALAVIREYPTRKVVQTPGFVEQGSNAAAAHATFCQQLKTVADAVIVVGEVSRDYFEQGLADWDGDVVYVPNREAAKKIYPQWLGKGDILLIINDLPEQY
ncbi:MAG: UDP-N-acetylmuramoyl-tripeptide--D-alanyl-D-alanine ligase [Clostridia bacterium]|nr:UDP-N-acetylmuramoyl-tripeptide--D-alanyl-D-alanine ligase [Clostridia bacterium]